MATLYSQITGDWTNATTLWNTAANGLGTYQAATNADACIVQSPNVVTLDGTCVCLNLTINTGAEVKNHATNNATLTVQQYIQVGSGTSNNNGSLNIDLSGTSTQTLTIRVNNAGASSNNYIQASNGSSVILKGYPKTRWTTLSAPVAVNDTTASVTAATGWATGDIIVFGTTSPYAATAAVDVSTGTNTVSGTSLSNLTAMSYAHASGGYVGNISSNLTINGGTNGWYFSIIDQGATAWIYGRDFSDVRFEGLSGNGLYIQGNYQSFYAANAFTAASGGITRCSFYKFTGTAIAFYRFSGSVARTDNIYCADNNVGVVHSHSTGGNVGGNCGVITRDIVFRASQGIYYASSGTKYVDCVLSGVNITAAGAGAVVVDSGQSGSIFENLKVFGCYRGVVVRYGSAYVTGGAIGTTFSATNNADVVYDSNTQSAGTWTGTTINTAVTSLQNTNWMPGTTIEFYDHTGSSLNQYTLTADAYIARNNSEINRSLSSISINPTRLNTACTKTISIPCANGNSIRVVGYTKKSHASNIQASVALSGLGSAWGGFADADNTNWQVWDTGVITNSSGADGNFNLSLSAQSSSGTTNYAYFDGIPDGRFIVKARHFGFTYEEGAITRTINKAVTIVAVDPAAPTMTEMATAEGVALALGDTEISVTGATSLIVLNANRTFQQVYDYTQAWASTTTNLDEVVPLTGAGVTGNAALFAVGSVTTTGYTLDGGGSLNILSGKTLTASLPFVYTYTNGTYSKASSGANASFSGGTLNIGAAGTYTYTQAASMTVSATPTSASNYVLSNGTFTGTLTFWNTTAYNITVEVPAGTTTSSAGSPGAGTVTFVSPQVYQSVVITGFTAGSRIYIYDTEGAGELLFNGTVSAGETVISGSTCTWTDATAAAANRVIFLRVAYVNGATAKEFIEVTTIGTCGITDGTKTVSYIVAQTADAVYDANAVTMDGTIFAACGITFTDAATDLVNINIAADTVALKTIYAAFAWWIFTSPGIDDDVAYIRAIDPANYELTSMKFRNTSTDPLKITDGYFYDSTGSVENCVDITSPGNIYPMPAHVVPYQTTGTYAITGDLQDALDAIAGVPADVLSAAQTTPIHSDVRKVVGITVDGTGTEGDPWGPA